MKWSQKNVDAFNARKGCSPRANESSPGKKGHLPSEIPVIPAGKSGKEGNSAFALGRMKAGKMNKTESLYRDQLEIEKRAGLIINYWFEAVNLRIGDNCFYKPDFLVMMADCSLELRETKGWMMDDALVKIRAVADKYPFPIKVVRLVKGSWEIKEY